MVTSFSKGLANKDTQLFVEIHIVTPFHQGRPTRTCRVFFCLRKIHIVTSFSIGYANKDIQFLCAKNAHNDAIFNALHGARFAREIFSNHTCRWMFHSLSHAFFVFKCYSHLRNSLLHGARFARKIFFNHTCRSMLLSLSDALFVLRCYSNLRISLLQASLTTYFSQSHLSLVVSLIFECFIRP